MERKLDKKERNSIRGQVLKLLRDSFVYNEQAVFTLSSGRKSRFYIDSKKVTLDPGGGFLVGQLILDAIHDISIDAIGGMTLGADPMAISASVLSYGEGTPLPAFIVRKDPKGYGDAPFVEGNLEKGSRVAIVDDVLTGGNSVERTINILKELDCQVSRIIALVDRKEGGKEKLEKLGYEVVALFTVEDLLKS
ncbi:MAG: orotate phosphoribosyltransferase [Nitrospirae bacterium]|nr:orotate phosphoribosyltransferase [Nitrospirota bacterium]